MTDEKPTPLPPGLEVLLARIRQLGPSQRYIWILAIAVGMGLVLLWGSNLGNPHSSDRMDNPPQQRALQRDEQSQTEEQWERELAGMLSRIKGAGEVWVDLTLEGSEIQVWQEKEETESRQVQEEGSAPHQERQSRVNRDLVFAQRNGAETPILRQKRRPRVLGAVIVAEGAGDPVVRGELWQAVAVSTGAELHKITVFTGEKQ